MGDAARGNPARLTRVKRDTKAFTTVHHQGGVGATLFFIAFLMIF